MTSVIYENIHLNSDSLKSIQKYEKFSQSQERQKLDRKRKSTMQKIAQLKKELTADIPYSSHEYLKNILK